MTPVSRKSQTISFIEAPYFFDDKLPEGEKFFAVLKGDQLKLFDSIEAS